MSQKSTPAGGNPPPAKKTKKGKKSAHPGSPAGHKPVPAGPAAPAGRHPPRANAEQLMKEALRLEGLQGLVGVSGDQVVWTGRVPAAAFGGDARAISLAIAIALEDPAAAALVAALGEDPAKIRDNLARQKLAWEAVKELLAVLSGAQDGRQVVDAARALARSLVMAAGEETLATLTGDAHARLEDDLQRLRDLQDAKVADKNAQRALTARIKAQGRGTLSDLQARKDLMTALDQISRGNELAWDLMVKTAATLDRLGGTPDLLPPEPTPDRRGGGRG